jgi:hypothetical protein
MFSLTKLSNNSIKFLIDAKKVFLIKSVKNCTLVRPIQQNNLSVPIFHPIIELTQPRKFTHFSNYLIFRIPDYEYKYLILM